MRKSETSRGKARKCLVLPTESVGTAGEKCRLAKHPVAKAISRMIVDHADGLHERIANRRTDE